MLKRVSKGVEEWLKVRAGGLPQDEPSDPPNVGDWADLNAEFAQFVGEAKADCIEWGDLQEALSALQQKPDVARSFAAGTKHWYNEGFGLSDAALAAGTSLLEAGDTSAANQLGALIQRTATRGRRGMRLLANLCAATEEWELGMQYYQQGRLPAAKHSPEQWCRQEYVFAELRRYFEQLGVHWVNLSPTRSRKRRMASLEDFVRTAISQGRTGDPKLGPILTCMGELRASEAESPGLAPAAPTVKSMNRKDFRNYVSGKSVCLVANSQTVATCGLGELIDSYDVVIRFNSFVIDPPNTGERIDVHVCIHLYDFNLEVPVDVRIMLSGKQELWEKSVHKRIVPGAQQYLGDQTLRWPARELGLIKATDPQRTPTAGYNMLRLLMHYDLSSKIDLIGFDFYASGMYRLSEALAVEHSKAHQSEAEKEWVMNRATLIRQPIISMK